MKCAASASFGAHVRSVLNPEAPDPTPPRPRRVALGARSYDVTVHEFTHAPPARPSAPGQGAQRLYAQYHRLREGEALPSGRMLSRFHSAAIGPSAERGARMAEVLGK